jgi:hypothetical protein
MRRISVIRRVTAAIAILVIFAGTQGFVISSHTCNSCGTHEESIIVFGTSEAESHECTAEKTGSCCSGSGQPEETHGSCCSDAMSSCEEIAGTSCCEYDTDHIAVETFTPEKSIRADIQIQASHIDFVSFTPVTRHAVPMTTVFHNKDGSGRDIIRRTCSLLI